MEDIRQQIIIAIQSLFQNVNTSASAIWMRLVDALSTIFNIISNEILFSEDNIANTARSLRVTRKDYYLDKALYFQYGDNLVILDNDTKETGYNPINENNRIIKQATVSTYEGGIILNVATTDNTGNLTPLSSEQLTAFKDYYENFIPLGFNLFIQSREPDILTFPEGMTVYYSAGNSLAQVKNDIESMKTTIQQNIVLGAPLFINDLEKSFQEVSGVEAAYIPDVVSTNGSLTYNAENGRIKLVSGYFNFAEDLNISYVPV